MISVSIAKGLVSLLEKFSFSLLAAFARTRMIRLFAVLAKLFCKSPTLIPKVRMRGLLVLLPLSAVPGFSQVAFLDGDNSLAGWSECYLPSCDPGGKYPPQSGSVIQQIVGSPALHGTAMQMSFTANVSGGTNVLYILKYSPVSGVIKLIHSFDFYWTGTTDQLEMDIFHFANQTEYMFGTQCNFSSGVWDVWNQQNPRWVPTTTKCSLAPNRWHYIVQYDTISGSNMIFKGIMVDGQYYAWNMTEPSGPLPNGWSDVEGVQWQCNIAKTGSCHMYVDHDQFLLNF